MNRYSLFLVPMMLAVGSNAFITACSGDDNNNPGDSGPDVVVKKDSGADVAPPPDGSPTVPPQNGKQLFASDIVQVFGVTSDNMVVFANNGGGAELYAVDATGATPAVQIAAPAGAQTSTYVVGISGNVVFLW